MRKRKRKTRETTIEVDFSALGEFLTRLNDIDQRENGTVAVSLETLNTYLTLTTIRDSYRGSHENFDRFTAAQEELAKAVQEARE